MTSRDTLSAMLLVDGCTVRAWEALAVRALRDADCVEAIGTKIAPTPGSQRNGRSGREERAGRSMTPTSMARSWLTSRALRDAALPEFGPRERETDRGEVAAVSRPDVILSLGECDRKVGFALNPRFGVWRFRHGVGGTWLGGPEFLEDRPTVEVVLEATWPSGDTATVMQGFFSTEAPSLATLRDNLLFGSAHWAGDACGRLVSGELALVGARAPAQVSPALVRRRDRVRLRSREARLRARAAVTGVARHGKWNVGVINRPLQDVVASGVASDVAWLPEMSDRYVADPFPVECAGQWHVFVEEYDYRTRHGVISHISLSNTGNAGEPEVVLRDKVHLSYPQIVRRGGELYMIPERHAANAVVAYAAHDFPRGWRPVATLVDGLPAVDSTVFEHDGRWWLMCTRYDRGQNRALYIFHSDDLFGRWVPHQCNPVKIDVRSSRPAGSPFLCEGVLYRPTQDCARTYGGAVVFTEIAELSPVRFSETPATTLVPDPNGLYPSGLHTVSACGPRTLIDGKRAAFVPAALKKSIAARLGAHAG